MESNAVSGMSDYIIKEWAIVRRNEMVDIPETLEIHPDFLKMLDHDEFESSFKQIWEMFNKIYTDIARDPQKFSMLMYKSDEYKYGSKEAGESRAAPWWIFYLLLYIFSSGEIRDCVFVVDIEQFKLQNKVKNIHTLIRPLYEYGFVFTGLQNDKLPKNKIEFYIEYPDNPNILVVLSLVAKKVLATQTATGLNHFGNSFISWNYRILKDGQNTADFGYEGDYVADKMHNGDDKAFVHEFHRVMKNKGYFHGRGGWNEGPDLCYYDKESVMKNNGPYLFRVLSWKGELRLMLRIRDVYKCMEYIPYCSGEILDMLRHSDKGCQNRFNGCCNKSVSYIFEEQERWHCGCCMAAFQLHPKVEDIPHYLKLVELGVKK